MTDPKVRSVAVSKIRGIFFDLHHTLTKTRVDFSGLTREAAQGTGIDISQVTDEKFKDSFARINLYIKNYQIEKDVSIHWGTEPEHWVDINREFLRYLGFENLADQTLIEFERAWKDITKTNWESLAYDAKNVLEDLNQRGYVLGLCTRRHDDPYPLLERWGILGLFSNIQWTAVPGYAKPSPYTLLQAAFETGINPRLCAYVGNSVDSDIGAAINAEMLPILTTWANSQEAILAPENTIVIDTLSELLEMFSAPPS
ncbi:MAG: HAD family hydrolase [Candidatus Thorarchaeota archaeon]